MVDFGFNAQTEDKRKKKKRKLRTVEENGETSDTAREVQAKETGKSSNTKIAEERQIDMNKKIKLEGNWKYLDFILYLENKNVNLQGKLELAFELVNSLKLEAEDESTGGLQTVSYSRLITFLIDWIQCRLIPDKKLTDEVKQAQLDFRCWDIFKFCIEKSLCLKVQFNLKTKLLDTFSKIGKDALSILEKSESSVLCERSELYSLIADCASLIFSSNGMLFKAEIVNWSETASTMLALVHQIYLVKICNDIVGDSLLRLSFLILEPFANVLRVNPNPKKTFRDFVNNLLEPLLSLLVLLNAEDNVSNSPPMTRKLLKTVEEILSNGLFHPVHLKEFLSTQSTEKDIAFGDVKCFFDKLKNIGRNKEKMSTLGAVGELFRLFVIRVKKQKGVPVLSESNKMNMETEDRRSVSKISAGNGSAVTDTNYSSNRLDMETGKSLFDNFELYIKPLMEDTKTCSKSDLEEEPLLLDGAHCTLQATNKILAIFMHEKIYLRTEDTDGVRLNFLKELYEILILLSLKIRSLWLSHMTGPMEMLPLVGKEIVVSLGHFLEIEYEVVGDDLVSLWTTMFSYLAMGTPEECSLASPILRLGCQLINTYSDLRQVSNPIFALCKAVRLFGVLDNADDENSRFGSHCLSPETCVKSVTTLLNFQEFRHAISKAIKSIPEGQANGCIRQLKMDISESLDWIKATCSKDEGKELGEPLRSCSTQNLNLQAELLGVALSELYAIVLDYLAVTTGNSVVVGNSIKDLMKVLGPSLSLLVGKHVDGVHEFLFSVTGRRFSSNKTSRFSASWISMFFFRLYVSCRSLYRQSVSRMPPDSSRKASEAMGDYFTSYSGQDCTRSNEWRDEGYFSWIIKSAKSLPTVLQSVLDFSHQGTVSGCAPLVYVMHTMAYQRLVDLNRRIKGLEFLREGTVGRQVEMKSADDASLPLYHNKSKIWEEDISVLRLEAEDVTEFLLGYLPLVVKMVESTFFYPCVTSKGKVKQPKHEDDAWDLGIPSLTEKSLATAVWYLLCQNTDIWCPHAKEQQLKDFLILLFRLFVAGARSSCKNIIKHKMGKPQNLVEVTLHKISMELLHDTCFYEQTFVCRHVASRFCRVLKTTVPQQFRDAWSAFVDFSEWLEVLSEHEKTSVVLPSKRRVTDDEMKPDFLSSGSPSAKYSKELISCQELLKLLCWMPKGYLNPKSFKVYATHILNLERVLVLNLLRDHGELKVDIHYEHFRLFLFCRKALKSLLVAFCEETSEVKQCSIIPLFSESPSSVLWLLKSVSTLLPLLPAFPEEHGSQVKYMSFSLMDHTSSALLTLTKIQFRRAIPSLISNEKPIAELPVSDGLRKHNLSDSDPSLGAWMEHIAEILKEHAQVFLPDEKLNAGLSVVDLNNLSCIIACFQGFLWGITYVLKTSTEETKFLSWWVAHRPFIGFFEKFIDSCFRILLVKDSRQLVDSYNGRILEPDSTNGSSRLASGIQKKRFKSNTADFTANILSEVDCYKRQHLNKPLLQSLLKGDNPEVAFCARQLFIGSSAILSLKLQIYNNKLSSSLMPIPIGTSEVLLMELAKMVEEPHPFSYVWLDGILKYLEVFGSYISSTNSTSSMNLYSVLIDMHLRAIGRCISLQGKGATLASHETESSTKTLMGQTGLPVLSLGLGKYSFDEFKARLRLSFKVLINKPLEMLQREKKSLESKKEKSLELHLLTAVEALESTLVGVHERWNMIYEIDIGGPDGGKVSPIVAAGIDCFDLVLESVSESKHPKVLKGHIQTSINALFNVVLHLQDQLIFYKKLTCNNGDIGPDAGAVILMCVEVLTKVAGKPKLFQMDFAHVVQSLRIPAALFQDFCHLRSSLSPSNAPSVSANQELTPVAGMLTYIVNRQFSVDLFAACCRLLSTVVRHHKKESERCISVLQHSVCVLLQCLETTDRDLVDRKGYYALEVQDGIKCASFLRRIYEEIRQQKEVIGRCTLHFLSNYIMVYSGYGPSKTGIRREIDEALRAGVYALVDACSTDDLQQLHTILGEGPCRSTLAMLQHNYNLSFKYEGKV